MQNIAKRQEAFRNSIRKRELEEYKKTRRRELLESQSVYERNNETYQAVMSHHNVNALIEMNQECLSDHLQMLIQLVFSENNQNFLHCFDKILVVLVDYYETIQAAFVREGNDKLQHLIGEEERQEILQTYCLTKVFSFVRPNSFLKLIGGIYYEAISSANLMYVQKVVKIIAKLLHFCFTDSQTLRHQLLHFSEELDSSINTNIYRSHIFQVLLNITFSEQKQIIDILKKHCIFETLISSVEMYGLIGKEIVLLTEMYLNTVFQLCQGIGRYSQQYQHEENIGFEDQQMNSFHIYVPLYEYLVGAFCEQTAPSLVKIANILIQTTVKHNLDCLDSLIYHTDSLIRFILQNRHYIDDSEKLFILFVMNYNEKSFVWLTDFFQLIFRQIISDFINERNPPEMRTKRAYMIKEFIRECSKLICKESVSYEICLYLVRQIFQFWLKGDIVIGSEEVIMLLKTAIQNDEDLAKHLVFDEYSNELLVFLGNEFYETKEILAILSLIQTVCMFVKQSDIVGNRNLRETLNEWQKILQRIQGYEMKGQNFDKSYHQQCSNAYNQVQSLINQIQESANQ